MTPLAVPRKIRPAGDGILVDAVEVRFVPEASALQFARPTDAACTQISNGLDKGPPVVALGTRWRRRVTKLADRVRGLHNKVEYALR